MTIHLIIITCYITCYIFYEKNTIYKKVGIIVLVYTTEISLMSGLHVLLHSSIYFYTQSVAIYCFVSKR